MRKREFKIVCNNCGNEDVVVDDYETTKDARFEFNYVEGMYCLECKECLTELYL